MTVFELIKALAELPGDAPVSLAPYDYTTPCDVVSPIEGDEGEIVGVLLV